MQHSNLVTSSAILAQAAEQAEFLRPLGFRLDKYPSSVRFSRATKSRTDEFVIRAVENVALRAEFNKILRRTDRQVVKSLTVTGNVEACVHFIKEHSASL